MSMPAGGAEQEAVQFRLVREMEAPRELVWRAWTEPGMLEKWWGPKGMTTRVARLELAPGGMFLYRMTGGGNEMWGRFIYREILPPEKLAYVISFSNPQGEIVRAPFNANFPLEVLNVVTFDQQGNRTVLTMRGTPLTTDPAELDVYRQLHASMEQGFGASLELLREELGRMQK